MNGVASQHSQSQSLLNTSTISGPAGIADHNSGAGSTSISNQQALQHSPHQDSSPPNDTNVPSDNPSSSDPDPLMTTAGEPPGDKDQERQGQIVESVVIKEEGEVPLRTVNGQIELLEHTPEVSVGSGDAEVMVNEDARDWIPDADHELKRVKVCQPLIPVISQIILLFSWDNLMLSAFNGKISLSAQCSPSIFPGVRTYWLTVDGSRDSVLLRPVSRRNK
jgi:hypothetical protein